MISPAHIIHSVCMRRQFLLFIMMFQLRYKLNFQVQSGKMLCTILWLYKFSVSLNWLFSL